ncbi:hypothetical protein [Micromonospora sp. L32]|uniref:hypothetical protein n=1 Tax=Micromonospora sp. L32 TaxID=3452214 RepID=UPI003F8BA4AA
MTSSLLDVRRGSQTPRVSTYPPAGLSSGPDIADLSEAAGLVLDPWQRYVLDHGMGERPDGKWAAREVACWVPRQNGKGALIEARVLAGLFLLGEKRILWSAHEYKTAQEGFLRIRELIQSAPDFDRLVKRYWEGSGEQGVELTTGQRLKFIARSKGSGRGFSGDCIILDEAQELTLLQMKALFSTMSAKSIHGNPQIWYLGTPPEDPAAWVYGIRKDGEAGKARLAYFDWGLGDVDPTVSLKARLESYQDRELWYRANPGLGIRISEEFCEDELSRLREGFAPERLGMWLPYAGDEDAGWQVIGQPAWMAAQNVGSQMEGQPAVAVYVPPDRSYAAIGLAGAAAGGGRHVEVAGNGQVLDYRPGTRWVVPRLKELEKHSPSVLVIDDKALADEAEEAGLVVHRATAPDVVTGCQLLYDGISGPDVAGRDVRHIGQPELTDAVRGAVKRDVGGSWAWARRDLAVDVTPLAAVSLALFGHSTPRVHRQKAQPFFGSWR